MHITTIQIHQPAGLLRIRIDGDLEGWCPGVPAASSQEITQRYVDVLIGEDPINRERIWQAMVEIDLSHHTVLRGYIDVALWDMVSKHADLPIYRHIGGFRDRVPAYKRGRADFETEQVVNEAVQARDDGFFGYKITCRPGPDAMTQLCRDIRRNAGPDFYLMLDGGQQYDIAEAIRIGHTLDETDAYCFDQPRPNGDFTGSKQVADEIDTPVTMGAVTLLNASQMLTAQAADMVCMGTPSCGGITDALKIARCAEAFGVHCHPMGTGIACGFAHAHLLGAIKNGPFYEVDCVEPQAEPIGSEVRVEDGHLLVPSGAGLGFEPDWTEIERRTDDVISA